MSVRETFRCGHLYVAENMTAHGDGHPRCRACQAAKKRISRKGRRRGQPEHTTLEETMRRSAMERASKALHRALYHSHPYVFDAAEKAGRQVVRPN